MHLRFNHFCFLSVIWLVIRLKEEIYKFKLIYTRSLLNEEIYKFKLIISTRSNSITNIFMLINDRILIFRPTVTTQFKV